MSNYQAVVQAIGDESVVIDGKLEALGGYEVLVRVDGKLTRVGVAPTWDEASALFHQALLDYGLPSSPGGSCAQASPSAL